MDFCEGGSLAQLIQRRKAAGQPVEDSELWRLAWDVAAGLDFLHSHHIMHLDIKPDNLYLTADGTCRIGDFGLAIANDDSSVSGHACAARCWNVRGDLSSWGALLHVPLSG